MGKTKQNAYRALTALTGAAVAMVLAHSASALSTSDRPASIIVWPKIIVDTSAAVYTTEPTDTLLELTNQATSTAKQAHCFYINANSHCSNNPAQVCSDATDCGGFACTPGWAEIDFNIYLTRSQPLAWYASGGLHRGDFPIEGPFFCNNPLSNIPCTFGCGAVGCNTGQSNLGSGIPPVPEDPFRGALVCIQFDPSANPAVPDQSATRNAFTGHATFLSSGPVLDVAKYNAVGLAATGNAIAPNGTDILQLGVALDTTQVARPPIPESLANQEYEGCPNTLVVDHLFDGAIDPLSSTNATTSTELTLIPCGNNFLSQDPGDATAQFLVFNEFEQRFSTSRKVDCLLDTQISNIDTRNNARSIFSAGVAGTIAGQTRIRGVGTSATGRGLLGVARLTTSDGTSAAYNIHQLGAAASTVDLITLP